MSRDLSEFLQDMLQGIDEIERFTQGVDFDDFQGNREKLLAVVKLLEIVGEAVKQIPNEIRMQYPQVAWRGVAGMRDILVHEYWKVDPNVVWATVQESLPILKRVITEILEDRV